MQKVSAILKVRPFNYEDSIKGENDNVKTKSTRKYCALFAPPKSAELNNNVNNMKNDSHIQQQHTQ